MRSLEEMIDRATRICGSKSAVARTLGDSPQTLYNYERGLRHMPASKVMRLATLANVNSVIALGRYEAEWAGKKTMGAAAGIAAAASTLVVLSAVPGDANAAHRIASPDVAQMHIMRRLREWLKRNVRRGRSALARGAVGKALTTPHAAIACS